MKSGCIFYGNRLVIPWCLQQAIPNRLHEDHSGGAAMLAMESNIWWPHMRREIRLRAQGCADCSYAGKKLKPIKPSLIMWLFVISANNLMNCLNVPGNNYIFVRSVDPLLFQILRNQRLSTLALWMTGTTPVRWILRASATLMCHTLPFPSTNVLLPNHGFATALRPLLLPPVQVLVPLLQVLIHDDPDSHRRAVWSVLLLLPLTNDTELAARPEVLNPLHFRLPRTVMIWFFIAASFALVLCRPLPLSAQLPPIQTTSPAKYSLPRILFPTPRCANWMTRLLLRLHNHPANRLQPLTVFSLLLLPLMPRLTQLGWWNWTRAASQHSDSCTPTHLALSLGTWLSSWQTLLSPRKLFNRFSATLCIGPRLHLLLRLRRQSRLPRWSLLVRSLRPYQPSPMWSIPHAALLLRRLLQSPLMLSIRWSLLTNCNLPRPRAQAALPPPLDI